MSLKQFNFTYYPSDDRTVFRFNTTEQSEYKFWLTRRIAHFILTSTGKFLENEYEKQSHTVAKVISEFQQSSDKQAPSFNKAYEPGSQYPIGSDPILVMDVRCEMMKIEDQDIFSLDFFLPGGGNLNLKLPLSIMQKMVRT